MTRILYTGTHGTDDPTKAALPFISANGAKEAGHEPTVVLIGDGTYLIKDQIRQSVTPVGFPPLSEIASTTITNGTPIHV